MARQWCIAFLAPILVACGSSEHRYATLVDAQQAGVISDGYLPDVLPESTRNLLVIRHWRSDRARGTLCFDPKDKDEFYGRLQTELDSAVWGQDMARLFPHLNLNGVRSRAFESAGGRWIFSCIDSNECSLCTWSRL